MSDCEYKENDLRRIQSIELEILRVFTEICDKLNIDYFADGGTALGAVRHRGFIPWDDDVDVGMTRDNYDRFLLEAPTILPDYLTIQSPYNDKQTPYYYSKIRYNGTKFVEYCNRKLNNNQGIYIDIFPFDEVPDDERQNKRQYRHFQRWMLLFKLRQSPELSAPPHGLFQRIKAIIRICAHFLVQAVPYCFVLKKLDSIATQFNGTGQSMFSLLPTVKRNWDCFRARGYKPFIMMPFESLSLKMLHDYDANLRSLYDDYMQLPPVEQRTGHRPYLLEFDL